MRDGVEEAVEGSGGRQQEGRQNKTGQTEQDRQANCNTGAEDRRGG